ncbi:hypothetical protein D3C81_1931210 [compost metagenome]
MQASTSARPEVKMPPGVRYGRSIFGRRMRRVMCAAIISTYDRVAPNTATRISRSPWPVSDRAKPMIPGMTKASTGALLLLVSDSLRGR